MQTVYLSESQVAECYTAARQRNEASKGYQNKRNCDLTLQQQANSFGAELATAISLGADIQTGINQRGRADIIHEGVHIDVKSTRGFFLSIAEGDIDDSLTYALVRIHADNKYELLGYVTGDRIRLLAKRTNYGNPSRPEVMSLHCSHMEDEPASGCPF